MVGGTCGSSEPEPAVFRKFIVWNCDKGLEYVNGGALQFHDSILVRDDCMVQHKSIKYLYCISSVSVLSALHYGMLILVLSYLSEINTTP